MNISDEVKKFVAENGGNEIDALNVAIQTINRLSDRVYLLEKLMENGLSEEEYLQSCEDYFDTMRSAMM